MIKLSTLKPNPDNPRFIKDAKFEKLKQSISEFPKMLELRPLIVTQDNIVIGGNMRLKALIELGYKDIPEEWITHAERLTEDEVRRFIIADNVGFGEHDWDLLANDWDSQELEDWGLDGFPFDSEDEIKENEINDLSDDDSIMFKLELTFESEEEQEKNYIELTKKGYKCQILTL